MRSLNILKLSLVGVTNNQTKEYSTEQCISKQRPKEQTTAKWYPFRDEQLTLILSALSFNSAIQFSFV